MDIKLVGTLPIKTHLLKYLYYAENLQAGEPIDLKSGGTISYFLKMLFTNKVNIDHNDVRTYLEMKKNYQSKLRFKIDSRMQAFSCYFITRKSIVVFNKFLAKLFHEFLMEKILRGIQEGKKEKEIIYQVMHELDIEDDVDFFTIKKAIDRLRNSKNIPSIHQQKRR